MKLIGITLFSFICLCFGRSIDVSRSDEIINYVNNVAKTTWRAGKNFEDGVRDTRTLLGTFMREPVKVLPQEENGGDLPEQFDARDKWGKMCPTIKMIRDQGPCGSCWAIAAATTMSDRLCIHTEGNYTESLSAQDIISCCDDCGNGCDGGLPGNAWVYWQYHGVPTGGPKGDKSACVPYAFDKCDHHVKGKYQPCSESQPTPICEKKCTKVSGKTYKDDRTFGDMPQVFNSEIIMKNAIFNHGPIQCSFLVYEDFLHYKSGVYKHVQGRALGGHSIRIIGWGSEQGVKYWLVANSWNEDWGSNGFFKILRGVNHVGIEQECYDAVLSY